jgi:hypothetical protein
MPLIINCRNSLVLCSLHAITKEAAMTTRGFRKAPPDPNQPSCKLSRACSGGNEDVVQARMRGEPGGRLEAVVTREIIGDHIDVSGLIVGLNIRKPRNVALRRCVREHNG